jgi:hypothetical protein
MEVRACSGRGTHALYLGLLALAACTADPEGKADRGQSNTMRTGNVPYASGTPQAGSTAPRGPTSDAGATQPSGSDPSDAATPMADAGPTLPTICAGDDAGIEDEDAGPRDCIVVGDLKLQYRAADTNATDNQIKPHFNLVNGGTAAVSLAEITIRYWFEDAGSASLVFWCDYAQIGCGSVQGAFVTSDREGGNRVLEVSFTGGMLAPGMATGEIQARFNKEDWSVFDESDDHSFDPSKTSFADWYDVTLYQRGTLIWGLEP